MADSKKTLQPEEENTMQEQQQQAGMYMTFEQLQEMMKSMIREMKQEPVKVENTNKIHKRIPAKQDMVKVKLFRDNGKYKDDVFVGLNGKRYMVPRGVEAEVPSGVYEILKNSMSQDEATEQYMRKKAEDWEQKQKTM